MVISLYLAETAEYTEGFLRTGLITAILKACDTYPTNPTNTQNLYLPSYTNKTGAAKLGTQVHVKLLFRLHIIVIGGY